MFDGPTNYTGIFLFQKTPPADDLEFFVHRYDAQTR